MPGISMIIGEPDRMYAARKWREQEVQAWVKAAFERGFRLESLEDRALRVECIAEMNRQLVDRGRFAQTRVVR